MEELPTINVKSSPRGQAPQERSTFQSASLLVAKKAERLKLTSVTLPAAFAALGKAVYDDTDRNSHFPEVTATIGQLLSQQDAMKETAAERPTGDTLGEQARGAAAQASDFVKDQMNEWQLAKEYAKLGEEAYFRFKDDPYAEDLLGAIREALARRDRIDSDIAGLSQQCAAGGWTRGRGIAVGAALIGLVLLWPSCGENKGTAGRGATAKRKVAQPYEPAHSQSTSNEFIVNGLDTLVGCPRKASQKYKEGWSIGIHASQIANHGMEVVAHNLRQNKDAPSALVQKHLNDAWHSNFNRIYESLQKEEESLRWIPANYEGRDFTVGLVDGYKYGLKHIFKARY